MTTKTAIKRLIALEAEISPGAFSGEILYKLPLANGKVYKGLTMPNFCWDVDNNPIAEGQLQETCDGKIAARYVETLDHYRDILVELPHGVTVVVDIEQVKERPTDVSLAIKATRQAIY